MASMLAARSKASTPRGPRPEAARALKFEFNLRCQELEVAVEEKKEEKEEKEEKDEEKEESELSGSANDPVWTRVQRLKRWALRLEAGGLLGKTCE